MNGCPASLPRALALAALLICGDASALALGEIHSASRVGERLHAEINVIAKDGERIEAGCVHFRKPAMGDGPWLNAGSFSVREERGGAVLDVRSAEFIRDPVVRIGLAVGCGFGVERDYVLNLESRAPVQGASAGSTPERVVTESSAFSKPSSATPRRSEKRIALAPRDRVLVSAVDTAIGDPGLRLALDLQSWTGDDAREARRDLLRTEYRLLQALNEQASSQLDAAEKLRQMEDALGGLGKRTDDSDHGPAASSAAPAPATAAPAVAMVPPESEKSRKNVFAEWGLWGLLALLLLALCGIALWRSYERRLEAKSRVRARPPVAASGQADETDDFDDPPRPAAFSGHAHQGTAEATNPLPVLTTEAPTADADDMHTPPVPAALAGATVHEHYQINPVMELADIMLSFGRVKGAAQALQEFIDHNPEEALQPWIRLMDVYRMAGMRSEFERVAADLNQHFNVEIQLWDDGASSPGGAAEVSEAAPAEPLPIQWPQGTPKAKSIEEMEHVRIRLLQLWPTEECADYLNQLLRNNRGGLRTGLALPVVGEIMFLVELLKTRASLEDEGDSPW